MLHPGRLAALLLVLLLVTAGCGADHDGSTATSAESAGSETFPVTIEHKFGSTNIKKKPQRLVSIGYQEHDAIFALGVEPVAVRYWFGDEDDVIFPWAEDEAGDADPEILNMPFGELNFEKIAALRPDLILAVYSGITQKEYDTLSEIAPTVAQTDEFVDFGVPWQESTVTVGRALGREQQAKQLVSKVQDQVDDVRGEHPEFEGRSAVVATYKTDEIGFFTSEDPRSRFFTSLGFEVPSRFDELAGDKFYGTLSREQIDLLDHDLLVWDQMAYVEGGRATIEGDPLVAALPVMKERRAIYLEDDIEDAFAFNTALSIPFLLEELVPKVADLVVAE